MALLPWTTLSMVITGDDLACATVAASWRGVSCSHGPTLRSFLSMTPDDARRALDPVPASARLVLTCPASWVGLRPAAIPVEQWGSAREQIRQSIESFFPLSQDDAMVGIVGRLGASPGAAPGGYLLAASRARVQPWLDAIQRVIGRPVDAVHAPQIGLLGLGLQAEARAAVTERAFGGARLVHRLRLGEIEELAGAPDETTDTGVPAGVRVLRLVSRSDEADGDGSAQPVPPQEQAVASALAERLAPGRFAPLAGRVPAAPPKWLAPAVGVAMAFGLFWMAGQIEDGRFERAMARLDQEQAARASALAEVRRTRDEALKTIRLLSGAQAHRLGGRPSVLAELIPALSVIPGDGVLYGVQFDRASLTLRGEARRASDVLQRLEETPEYQAARQLDTAVAVEERGTEQFHIRAERASAARATRPASAEPARGEDGPR